MITLKYLFPNMFSSTVMRNLKEGWIIVALNEFYDPSCENIS